MKYHKHLFYAVCACLADIFFENRYADKAIEYHFRHNKKWGKRDRQFFAESVYDCVRWWRLYWHLLGSDPHQDKLPALLGVSLWHRGLPLPDWSLGINEEKLRKKQERIDSPAVSASVPDWLYQLGSEQLKEKWPEILRGLNKINSIVLRANLLLTSVNELRSCLKNEEIDTDPLINAPEALVVMGRKNVFRTEAFKNGLFEVQDGSSQGVAHFLDLEAGQTVVDACAGAGGKSLHIGALLQNKGRVVAMDIHQWKLDELKLRARRGKLNNIETKLLDSTKVIKRLAGKADRLLLDVPCSGLGVLRRNPDAKWKLNSDKLVELIKTQREILRDYARMVKPGGIMVYATCSILPVENEDQVTAFIKENPQFELVKQKWHYPVVDGYDGFYMAQLKLRCKTSTQI